MEKTYTKEEVLELLEKQRKHCLSMSVLKRHEYNNPYSNCDGEVTYSIEEKSILDAKIVF